MAGLTLLTLGLAACGTPHQAAAPAAASSAAVQPAVMAPPRQAVLPEGERLAAVGPAAVAVPAGPLPGPDRLAGLAGDDVAALLGPPGFVRRDPPAEVWQYRTDACVLDLFLYADAAGGPPRVDHLEFRGRTVAGVVPAECYRELLDARTRPAG